MITIAITQEKPITRLWNEAKRRVRRAFRKEGPAETLGRAVDDVLNVASKEINRTAADLGKIARDVGRNLDK